MRRQSEWEASEALDAAMEPVRQEFRIVREQVLTLEHFIRSNGFRRCDIAACNCDSWHGVDGIFARWRELEEVLEPRNGQTLLDRAKELAGC